MYKRKITETLKKWKATKGHNPIVIKGCRQCGKTSSVLEFAQGNYEHIVYMDFHQHKEYKDLFAGSLDINDITLNITGAIKGAKFVPGKTCIIFDEIQDCARARSSLKFFKLDGRYDVIATGSLLGVNGYKTREEKREDELASIPVGFEYIVNMYPMDFEEWLWANGIEQQHIDYLKSCLANETPVNAGIHNRMRELLRKYIVVGGMPEAVKTFFETNDMNEVLHTQRNIVENYKADMLKYALQEDKPRIRECFMSIPAQLAKENKKFQYSTIKKGARASQYRNSLQWIEDAGIIRRCYNTLTPEIPLQGNAIPDCFKVYMADIGLLVSMLDEGTAWSIINDSLYGFKGAIYENLAADIFGKMGKVLYYFHKDSGLEIDFLMRYKGECVPVECKAKTGNAKSLKTLLAHPEKYHVFNAIKIGDYNVGRADEGSKVLTLPFYMAFLLTDL